MGKGRKLCRVLAGKPEGREDLKYRGVDGWMGLEWILGRLAGGRVTSGLTWLRMGTGDGIS
jgi:hypothetical protein